LLSCYLLSNLQAQHLIKFGTTQGKNSNGIFT
jgi:hypothetical protein